MSPCGCVCVTLCRGQGGTLADSTQRGYHNSWKIVEMAAEAGLLLSDIHPFNSVSYPGYVPTGYRGEGKGFVVDDTLEHVFTLPQLDNQLLNRQRENPVSHICQYCCGGVSELEVCTQLRKAGLEDVAIRSLLSLAWHPVTRVHTAFLKAIRRQEDTLWSNVWSEVRERVMVHRVPSLCCPNYCVEDIVWHVRCGNKLDIREHETDAESVHEESTGTEIESTTQC